MSAFTEATLGYDDILTFGKHKNKTVGETIAADPAYLRWLIYNDHVEFEDEIYELLEADV